MSFKVTATPTFLSPVTAMIPGDRGKFQKVTFHVKFKRPDMDEYKDLTTRLSDSRKAVMENPGATPEFGDRQFLDELLVGFGEDLQEEDGTPMPFTPENVDRVLAIFPIQPRMVTSFFDNYGKAAEKN